MVDEVRPPKESNPWGHSRGCHGSRYKKRQGGHWRGEPGKESFLGPSRCMRHAAKPVHRSRQARPQVHGNDIRKKLAESGLVCLRIANISYPWRQVLDRKISLKDVF